MKSCAYCKLSKNLTREHIIPSWVLREQPTSNVRFDLKQQRVSERVPTIRDVCSDCNNGPLSVLDNYGLTLYDQYFSHEISKQGVTFEYDYDLLARWLLKVTFNSARNTNSRADELVPFTDYILGKQQRPANFRILCFLLRPTIVTRSMRRKLGENYAGLKSFPPRSISVTRLSRVLPNGTEFSMGRAMLINSYFFVIVTVPAELARSTRRQWMAEITDEFEKMFHRVYIIDPRFNRMKLMMSDVDLRKVKKDSLTMFKDAYDDYYQREQRKKSNL